MSSSITEGIAQLLTRRNENRKLIFGSKPYANYGYWTRPGMTVEEACDALTDLVAEAAQIGPEDRVLEVGCGCAASAVRYTQHCRPASVTGLDATDVRIQEGRAFVTQQGLADKILLEVGDATRLRFAPDSFTKVLAVECAFHFNTRHDFLREAARVLVPGGVLALTDNVVKPGIDPAEYRAAVHFPIGTDGSFDVADNAHDSAVYADRLRGAGFEILRLEVITEPTMGAYAAHLECIALQQSGEVRTMGIRCADLYREYAQRWVDVILVAARKPPV